MTIRKEAKLLARDLGGLAVLFIMPVFLVIVVTLIQNNTYENITNQRLKLLVIVEFANVEQRLRGLDRVQAVRAAAATRIRPILMTTAAMVGGLMPLLFASGAGANSRFGLGVVIVCGMLIGTLFTLFVLPTVYAWLARDHRVHSPRKQQLEEAEQGLALGHREARP